MVVKIQKKHFLLYFELIVNVRVWVLNNRVEDTPLRHLIPWEGFSYEGQ